MAWSPNQPKKQDNRKNSWGRGWKWQGHWGWGGLGENLKKGGRGVGNKGGLVPLCQLSETFKISHPPITKLTPHSWLPLISSKIFTSLHYSHFWEISSPLYAVEGGGGYDYVPSIHYMIKGFKIKTEELYWCHFHCLMYDAKDKFLLLGLFCTRW